MLRSRVVPLAGGDRVLGQQYDLGLAAVCMGMFWAAWRPSLGIPQISRPSECFSMHVHRVCLKDVLKCKTKHRRSISKHGCGLFVN